jgi:ribosome-associated heat shock protein Hsp15
VADSQSQPGNGGGRLDRWLWFARVIKSRTLAAGLIEDGRVRLNRQKVTKPSQSVRPGDVLTITVGPRVRILKVVALGVRRGPAPEARLLYEDLTPPMEKPDPASLPDAERERGTGRPTKRDRRRLDRFKGEDA